MTLEEKKQLLDKLNEYWEEIDPEYKEEQKKVYDAIEVIVTDIEYMEEGELQNKILFKENEC